jgi:hypothetical protein
MTHKMSSQEWREMNQEYLRAAIDCNALRLHIFLQEHLASTSTEHSETAGKAKQPDYEKLLQKAEARLASLHKKFHTPNRLDSLCEVFRLTAFERNILLLCVGMELSGEYATTCAKIHQNDKWAYPTFSLAMAAYSESHWSATSPARPLRYWKIIEVEEGPILTVRRIRIDETILHYLNGLSYWDARIAELYAPVGNVSTMGDSTDAFVLRIATAWREQSNSASLPVILQLAGDRTETRLSLAKSVCNELHLTPLHIPVRNMPQDSNTLLSTLRLMERQAALEHNALFLDATLEFDDQHKYESIIQQVTQNTMGWMILSVSQRQVLQHQRETINFDIKRPGTEDQKDIWNTALADKGLSLDGEEEQLTAHFNLSASEIQSVITESIQKLNAPPVKEKRGHKAHSSSGKNEDKKKVDPDEILFETIWDTCREQARRCMEESLVQRIDSLAGWDDLVLPETQKMTLQEIVGQVRSRHRVYEDWGFGSKSNRGLGISALFSGASGTGKTMAAEVIAKELKLDLYRIDLSAVVSKYIGETEKNLRRVFDTAEAGGAILLFDEADALFGKRSDVKDSHDRHANIEVSYLLQRMELYQGLAILTTNHPESLDTAFLRRIRFIVNFPFPNPAMREKIWETMFPKSAPKAHDFDSKKLARLDVAGGNIRNIALNAAFMAADAERRITMKDILQATRSEYNKLNKVLTEADKKGIAP